MDIILYFIKHFWIIWVAFAILVIFVLLIVLVANKRKKRKGWLTQGKRFPVDSFTPQYTTSNAPTEFLTPEKPKFLIRISDTNRIAVTWELTVSDSVTIGRSQNCDIILTDSSVSREHCRISIVGNRLVLSDLESTNKTIINGVGVVNECPIQPGDRLKIGRYSLRIDSIQLVGGSPPTINRDDRTAILN